MYVYCIYMYMVYILTSFPLFSRFNLLFYLHIYIFIFRARTQRVVGRSWCLAAGGGTGPLRRHSPPRPQAVARRIARPLRTSNSFGPCEMLRVGWRKHWANHHPRPVWTASLGARPLKVVIFYLVTFFMSRYFSFRLKLSFSTPFLVKRFLITFLCFTA